jgi:hypothetical protein
MIAPRTRGAGLCICVVSCLLLAGCSDAPSTSEIKDVFVRQGAGAPDNMSCAVNKDATASIRAQFPGQRRWVMDCQWTINGGTGGEQVPLLRDDSGQLRIGVR